MRKFFVDIKKTGKLDILSHSDEHMATKSRSMKTLRDFQKRKYGTPSTSLASMQTGVPYMRLTGFHIYTLHDSKRRRCGCSRHA